MYIATFTRLECGRGCVGDYVRRAIIVFVLIGAKTRRLNWHFPDRLISGASECLERNGSIDGANARDKVDRSRRKDGVVNRLQHRLVSNYPLIIMFMRFISHYVVRDDFTISK